VSRFCPDVYNGLAVSENSQENVVTESGTLREQEPMLYCPVCSRRLAERKCKLFCEQCGYYMSCADYY
jgi:hypothetical protein